MLASWTLEWQRGEIEGFEPPAELSLVNGTPWRAATDALAARVMAAGAVGIDFVDPLASCAIGDLMTKPA